MAGILFQLVFCALVIVALVVYLKKNRSFTEKATRAQTALAAFQILLCGYFFALSLSDILDVPVNFSLERLVMDIFYDLAFLILTIFVIFNNRKEEDKYFKIVLWGAALLIVMQCFVLPYEKQIEALRVVEALEGAVVFGLLVALSCKLENVSFGRKSLIIIVALELFVAIESVILPMASVSGDVQLIDIPLNYAAFFMRPVLFASIALTHQVWIDRHQTGQRTGTPDPDGTLTKE